MQIEILKIDSKYAFERAELIWKNKEFFTPYLSWVDFVVNKQDSVAKLSDTIEKEKDVKDQTFHIFCDSKLVGQISIFNVTEHNGEIGYWLDQDFGKKGIMSKAVKQVCKYGFEKLGLHRIEICCDPMNEPSKKVALNCGFTFEGTHRQNLVFREKFRDTSIYSILKYEYNKPINST